MIEIDNACASCGEKLYHPFTGEELKNYREVDLAYDAHSAECEGEFSEAGSL